MITTGLKKFFNPYRSNTGDGNLQDLKNEITASNGGSTTAQFGFDLTRQATAFQRLTSISYPYFVDGGGGGLTSVTAVLKRIKYNAGSADTETTIATSASGYGTTNNSYQIGVTTVNSPSFFGVNDGHIYRLEVTFLSSGSGDIIINNAGLEVVYDEKNLVPDQLFYSSAGNITTSSPVYLQPFGGNINELNAIFQIINDCVITDLYVFLRNAPGTGNSYTVTVRKNVTDTSLAVTISGTATTGNNTTNPISFAAGDKISVKVTSTGTPTQGNVSVTLNRF